MLLIIGNLLLSQAPHCVASFKEYLDDNISDLNLRWREANMGVGT